MKKQKRFKQKRKLWYRALKRIMRIRYKQPDFVYLGEKPSNGSIILSNHEGTDAPMSLEIYCDFPIRMWGTAEMNSGLIRLYKYQTRVYYHEKKHWSLFWARVFCILASPLTYLFYRGLRLISTYKDSRFRKTIKESVEAIKQGENVVIFPEVSEGGYHAQLKGFFAGFVLFAQECFKEGIDLPIYVSYYKKDQNVYYFDKPISYSKLKEVCPTRQNMADYLVEKCNALGRLDYLQANDA